MTEPAPAVARTLWRTLEPVHAMIYFAPEAMGAYRDLGLKGGWMGYFASRAAAMGAVPAEVVRATFFNFAPSMVERAIPDAWELASPEAILAARLQAADAALHRLLGEATLASPEVAEAAELAREATAGADPAGRALFGGHASLPWPEPAHLRLWHAITLLREHRGDGHVAVLTAEGIGGLEAHVLIAGEGVVPRSVLQPYRGWTDEEWTAAEARLRKRGLVHDGGTLSQNGHDLRSRVEARTDRLAIGPYTHIGAEGADRLRQLVKPLSRAISDAGGFPIPNPVGVPAA